MFKKPFCQHSHSNALLQSLHTEELCFWQEVSGQQISAFALQIGDLPFHPSSAATAAAAAAHFHLCHPLPTVAKEMLPDPQGDV